MMGIFKQARKIDILVGACEEHRNRLHRSKTVTSYVDLQNKNFVKYISGLSFMLGMVLLISGIMMNKININNVNFNIGLLVLLLSSIYIILSINKYKQINAQGYTINMLGKLPEVKEFEETDKEINVLEVGGLYWLLFITFLALMAFVVSVWEYVWWISIGAVVFGIIFLYYWNRNFQKATEILLKEKEEVFN